MFDFIYALGSIAAFFTFWKTFLQKVKISLNPGDAIRIVIDTDGSSSKFHLMCNLINTGAKAGIVQRLEAEVKGQNAIYRFKWDNFYKYLEGGERVQKEYDSHPVIVPAKDSKLLRIQFKTDDGGKCEWKLGEEYEFRVFGWMNLEDRKKPRNLESATFHFQIDQDFIEHQKNPGQEGMYVPRPFIEWEREQQ